MEVETYYELTLSGKVIEGYSEDWGDHNKRCCLYVYPTASWDNRIYGCKVGEPCHRLEIVVSNSPEENDIFYLYEGELWVSELRQQENGWYTQSEFWLEEETNTIKVSNLIFEIKNGILEITEA